MEQESTIMERVVEYISFGIIIAVVVFFVITVKDQSSVQQTSTSSYVEVPNELSTNVPMITTQPNSLEDLNEDDSGSDRYILEYDYVGNQTYNDLVSKILDNGYNKVANTTPEDKPEVAEVSENDISDQFENDDYVLRTKYQVTETEGKKRNAIVYDITAK